MNRKLALLAAFVSKISRQHIQLAFVMISLTLLVLGAGAPTDNGEVGH
ncbi:MAG: hypothetical protein HY863_05600 [Chloroflexi bacterium]|nr:hypothetical protein [Chloroflexota bacterium]